MHPYSNQQYIILYQMNAESNMYNPWKIRMFLVVGGGYRLLPPLYCGTVVVLLKVWALCGLWEERCGHDGCGEEQWREYARTLVLDGREKRPLHPAIAP